jgi:rod shape determining protein RodA
MTARFNWLIVTSVSILFILSSALILSLAPTLFSSHLVAIFIGILVFGFVSRIDYQIFNSLFVLFESLAIFFLGSSLLFGSLTRSTLRWIRIGSLTFQPSELVKPLLILSFASFASLGKWHFRKLLLSLALLFLPAFLIFQQPDLGSALVIGLVWLAIIFSKVNKKQAFFLSIFFLFSLLIGWFFLKSYQRERIFAFLNPLGDPLGQGYHLIQATIAAGSGKFFGRGLLRGTQSHLKFLPERHSDFIFASLAEELGFVGSSLLLLVYFLLLTQILKVARSSRDEFGTLICLGVFALFFAQVFINIGMNLGLLPITGITLPLVSSGGSSILSLMASLGLVEAVAGKSKAKKAIEIR